MIPLIESNRWRHAKKPEDLEKTENDQKKNSDTEIKEGKGINDVDSLAVKELLQGIIKFIDPVHRGCRQFSKMCSSAIFVVHLWKDNLTFTHMQRVGGVT